MFVIKNKTKEAGHGSFKKLLCCLSLKPQIVGDPMLLGDETEKVSTVQSPMEAPIRDIFNIRYTK